MKAYGITGSIAAGKSAVQDLLAQHWPVIDADLVSREVVAPGSEGLEAVVAAFGEDVLQEDGSLNRAGLRNVIAHSREAQQQLNGILHPRIIGTIQERVTQLGAEGHPVVFVSAALMLETGSYKNYGGVIVISASEEIRLARLLSRDGMNEEAARNLMAKQMPDAEKRTYASVVIENNGTLEELETATWSAMGKLGLAP